MDINNLKYHGSTAITGRILSCTEELDTNFYRNMEKWRKCRNFYRNLYPILQANGVQWSSLVCCLIVVCTPLIIIFFTLADDILKWGSEDINGHHDSLTHQELLVIDTDADLDAAVAILAVLADPLWGSRLAAITCMRGNASAEVVARNMLKILKLAGRIKIPVFIGSSVDALQIPQQPEEESNKLNSKDRRGSGIKQKNWLSINNLLKLDVNLSLVHKEHAAVYLANLVQQNAGMVSLLVLGPMTNIALAMRLNPDFMSQVKKVVTLGGYVKGPGKGCYHHNNIKAMDSIANDPDSSAFVLRGAYVNNFKLTILPIDTITSSFISKVWLTSNLKNVSNPVINFILTTAGLTEGDHWDINAVYAAALLMRSSQSVIQKSDEYFVDVEVMGKLTRGVMVVDYYNVTGRKANAEIVFELNKTAIESMVLNSFL